VESATPKKPDVFIRKATGCLFRTIRHRFNFERWSSYSEVKIADGKLVGDQGQGRTLWVENPLEEFRHLLGSIL
jgi:hypothetical protein